MSTYKTGRGYQKGGQEDNLFQRPGSELWCAVSDPLKMFFSFLPKDVRGLILYQDLEMILMNL